MKIISISRRRGGRFASGLISLAALLCVGGALAAQSPDDEEEGFDRKPTKSARPAKQTSKSKAVNDQSSSARTSDTDEEYDAREEKRPERRVAGPAREADEDLPPRGRREPVEVAAKNKTASVKGKGSPAPRVSSVMIAPKLKPEELKRLNALLEEWEIKSAKVNTFRCKFVRQEFDKVFGPTENDELGRPLPKTVSSGDIKYAAPDKGMIRVTDKLVWDGEKKRNVPSEVFEHWICNGLSVFEMDHAGKRLIERPLPTELQGKAIINGPLPFLFGAKAEDLKRRFVMKVVTPPSNRSEVWLAAWPLFHEDAANYAKATLILSQKDLLPLALQLIMPDGNNETVYTFDAIKSNDPFEFFKKDFSKPGKPRGWTVEVIPPDSARPLQGPPLPPGTQARRPTTPAKK